MITPTVTVLMHMLGVVAPHLLVGLIALLPAAATIAGLLVATRNENTPTAVLLQQALARDTTAWTGERSAR